MPVGRPAGRTLKYRMLKVVLWGGNHALCWALRRGIAPAAVLARLIGMFRGSF